MRESNQRGLWLRSLRSHRSQSPSGTCAEWRTQQPSSGCEGDDHAADAHGRSAESPRWAWAGGGLGGERSFGLRLRSCKSVAFRLMRACNTSGTTATSRDFQSRNARLYSISGACANRL